MSMYVQLYLQYIYSKSQKIYNTFSTLVPLFCRLASLPLGQTSVHVLT